MKKYLLDFFGWALLVAFVVIVLTDFGGKIMLGSLTFLGVCFLVAAVITYIAVRK